MRSFCSNDPGPNLSDLDLESNPNQFHMACWARIVTYFTGTILFLMSECTKSMWQSVTIVWQAACHTFCSGIRSQSNQNRIQSARWVSIVLTSVSQLSFRSFLTAGWTKTDVTIVWQLCDKQLVTHLSQPDSPPWIILIESRCKKYRWVGPVGHPDTAIQL